MKTNLKKSRIEKTKIGYGVLGLRKPNFKTNIIPFEKSHNAGNRYRFFNIHSVAKFQKIEEVLKQFSKKKQ